MPSQSARLSKLLETAEMNISLGSVLVSMKLGIR